MTPSTSAVAVCCSSASRVSVMRRAFSIAIAAWAAKLSRSAISCWRTASPPRGRRRCSRAALPRGGTGRAGLCGRHSPQPSASARRRFLRPVPSGRGSGRGARRPAIHRRQRWSAGAGDIAPRPSPDAAHALRRAEMGAVVELQRALRGPTEAMRFLQDRVEDGRQVAGRGIDDSEHLCGRVCCSSASPSSASRRFDSVMSR